MPQIVNGLLLGQGIYVFRDAGPPTASTDSTVLNANFGSLYLNVLGTPGSTLWVLTASGWSAIA
jgi:hypothetical protein